MNEITDAAERLLESYGKWTDASGRTTCGDIRKVCDAYLRILDRMETFCLKHNNSASSPERQLMCKEMLAIIREEQSK